MKTLQFYLIGFLLLTASEAEAITLRLNQPKIELELAPGETHTGEISIENPTSEEAKIRVYLEDWVYKGGNGDKDFFPLGTTPASAGKWIVFTPTEDIVKPFGRLTVRYTLTVPPDAKGGYYAVIFFETTLGAAKQHDGAMVMVASRIGSLILAEVKGTVQRKGTVESIQITPPRGNKPMEVETFFKNTGNVHVMLGGNYLIMDTAGKVVGRGDLTPIYSFPNATESGKSQWVGRLPKGAYTLFLTYDLGKGTTIVEEKPLRID